MSTNSNGTNGTNGNTQGLTRLFYLADGTLLALPADTHYTVLELGTTAADAPSAPRPRRRRPGLRGLSGTAIAKLEQMMGTLGVPTAAERFGLNKQTLWNYAKRNGIQIRTLRHNKPSEVA